MTETTLSVRGLNTVFETRAGTVRAVRDVSFDVGRGEIVAIVGESGSGKTATGFSIMGLVDKPGRVASGQVFFKGENILGKTEEDLRALRGDRIAMIFQDPMMTLNPVLRVSTQMIETIRAHRTASHAEAWERSRDVLGQVGIPSPSERMAAFPHELSGGMRQRVCIAIALLHQPDLIIADEPTTALDVTIQAQILGEVQKLTRRSGTSVIWITHDLAVVAGLADRIVVMYAGEVVESGTVDDVLDRPRHPYTDALIRSIPSQSRPGAMLAQIQGTTPNLLFIPEGCAFRPRCTRATQRCFTPPPLDGDATGRFARCFHPLGSTP